MTTPVDDLWSDVRAEAARRLLFAAIEAFARRGYHATSTREIAAAAGMSPAALYVHYPSKPALLFEISRAAHQKALDLVAAAYESKGDAAARMRRLVVDFTTWHAHTHTLALVAQHELDALPEAEHKIIAEMRRRTEDTVRRLVHEGVGARLFDVRDVRTTARAVLSLGVDVSRWYNDRYSITPEELGEQHAELTLRMLGAAPPPAATPEPRPADALTR